MGQIPEFILFPDPQPYEETLQKMAKTAQAIAMGEAPEQVWLLQHSPVYTLGTSAKEADLLNPDPTIPQVKTGRGGQVTYHGPGMLVVYPLLRLQERGKDVRAYVRWLEQWICRSLATVGIEGAPHPERIGIWTQTPQGEAKIAAIGVRIQKWITTHGFALNVCPDLSPFQHIVPCGIRDFGVTSLKALGQDISVKEMTQIVTDCYKS